jgi:hypothetical protein
MSVRPIAKNEKKTMSKSFLVTFLPFFPVMVAYIGVATKLKIKAYVSANAMFVINSELKAVVGLEIVADKINVNVRNENILSVLSEIRA